MQINVEYTLESQPMDDSDGDLQLDQARKMKYLERENARLRRLVADLSLEKQVLADV